MTGQCVYMVYLLITACFLVVKPLLINSWLNSNTDWLCVPKRMQKLDSLKDWSLLGHFYQEQSLLVWAFKLLANEFVAQSNYCSCCRTENEVSVWLCWTVCMGRFLLRTENEVLSTGLGILYETVCLTWWLDSVWGVIGGSKAGWHGEQG